MKISRLQLTLISALCTVFSNVGATEISWVGNYTGYWENATNWQPQQVPGLGDSVVIYLSNNYTIYMKENVTVSSLQFVGGMLQQVRQNLVLKIRNSIRFVSGTIRGPSTGKLIVYGNFTFDGTNEKGLAGLAATSEQAITHNAGAVHLSRAATLDIHGSYRVPDGGTANLKPATWWYNFESTAGALLNNEVLLERAMPHYDGIYDLIIEDAIQPRYLSKFWDLEVFHDEEAMKLYEQVGLGSGQTMYRTMMSGVSLDSCAVMCWQADWCMGFDYHKWYMACFMSELAKEQVGLLSISPEHESLGTPFTWSHYEKFDDNETPGTLTLPLVTLHWNTTLTVGNGSVFRVSSPLDVYGAVRVEGGGNMTIQHGGNSFLNASFHILGDSSYLIFSDYQFVMSKGTTVAGQGVVSYTGGGGDGHYGRIGQRHHLPSSISSSRLTIHIKNAYVTASMMDDTTTPVLPATAFTAVVPGVSNVGVWPENDTIVWDVSYDVSTVDIDAGGSLVIWGNTAIRAKNVTVDGAGAELGASTLALFIDGGGRDSPSSLYVGYGASVHANGLGHPTDIGPGKGVADNEGGSGGGHGGEGGNGYSTAVVGQPYGSIFLPLFWGSGGGSASADGEGGYGGGSVRIFAPNVQLFGTISANGEAATYQAGGGGSGGSVFVNVTELYGGRSTGTGAIEANGGDGGYPGGWLSGGGGSGGRVAVLYTTWDFNGSTTAFGGEQTTQYGSDYEPPGCGTIYLQRRARNGTILYQDLLIDNNNRITGKAAHIVGDDTASRGVLDRVRVLHKSMLVVAPDSSGPANRQNGRNPFRGSTGVGYGPVFGSVEYKGDSSGSSIVVRGYATLALPTPFVLDDLEIYMDSGNLTTLAGARLAGDGTAAGAKTLGQDLRLDVVVTRNGTLRLSSRSKTVLRVDQGWSDPVGTYNFTSLVVRDGGRIAQEGQDYRLTPAMEAAGATTYANKLKFVGPGSITVDDGGELVVCQLVVGSGSMKFNLTGGSLVGSDSEDGNCTVTMLEQVKLVGSSTSSIEGLELYIMDEVRLAAGATLNMAARSSFKFAHPSTHLRMEDNAQIMDNSRKGTLTSDLPFLHFTPRSKLFVGQPTLGGPKASNVTVDVRVKFEGLAEVEVGVDSWLLMSGGGDFEDTSKLNISHTSSHILFTSKPFRCEGDARVFGDGVVRVTDGGYLTPPYRLPNRPLLLVDSGGVVVVAGDRGLSSTGYYKWANIKVTAGGALNSSNFISEEAGLSTGGGYANITDLVVEKTGQLNVGDDGHIVITNTFLMTGGVLEGRGEIIIAGTATMTLSPTVKIEMEDQVSLRNEGNLLWTSGDILMSQAASITNNRYMTLSVPYGSDVRLDDALSNYTYERGAYLPAVPPLETLEGVTALECAEVCSQGFIEIALDRPVYKIEMTTIKNCRSFQYNRRTTRCYLHAHASKDLDPNSQYKLHRDPYDPTVKYWDFYERIGNWSDVLPSITNTEIGVMYIENGAKPRLNVDFITHGQVDVLGGGHLIIDGGGNATSRANFNLSSSASVLEVRGETFTMNATATVYARAVGATFMLTSGRHYIPDMFNSDKLTVRVNGSGTSVTPIEDSREISYDLYAFEVEGSGHYNTSLPAQWNLTNLNVTTRGSLLLDSGVFLRITHVDVSRLGSFGFNYGTIRTNTVETGEGGEVFATDGRLVTPHLFVKAGGHFHCDATNRDDQYGSDSVRSPGVSTEKSGAGGAYGGEGGQSRWYIRQIADAYGSIFAPILFGSDGGSSGIGEGGRGGGKWKIEVTNHLRVEGELTCDGGWGTDGVAGGGGSGGSLFIQLLEDANMTGSGIIGAKGGDGGQDTEDFTFGGGGSGGRISIETYGFNNGWNREVTPFAGEFRIRGGGGYEHGSAGTVYIRNMGPGGAFEYHKILVDNGGNSTDRPTVIYDNMAPGAYKAYPYNRIEVLGKARLELRGGRYVETYDLVGDGTGEVVTMNGTVLSLIREGEKIDTEWTLHYMAVNLTDGILCGSENFKVGHLAHLYLYESGKRCYNSVSGSDLAAIVDGQGFSGNVPLGHYNFTALTLVNNGTVSVHSSSRNSTKRVTLIANLIDVEQGCALHADGLGYRGAKNGSYVEGEGAGAIGGSGGSGGGHGGYGGQGLGVGALGDDGGGAYGNVYNPTHWGSGGGSSLASSGGHGGGLIYIRAHNLVVNGRLSADGKDGLEHGGGGGAGGSINLLIKVLLSGTGTISVRGGDGQKSLINYGGGGAGGRIAILYDTMTYSGDILAQGGTVKYDNTVPEYNYGSITNPDNIQLDDWLEQGEYFTAGAGTIFRQYYIPASGIYAPRVLEVDNRGAYNCTPTDERNCSSTTTGFRPGRTVVMQSTNRFAPAWSYDSITLTGDAALELNDRAYVSTLELTAGTDGSRNCEVVIAGNSTLHLNISKAGPVGDANFSISGFNLNMSDGRILYKGHLRLGKAWWMYLYDRGATYGDEDGLYYFDSIDIEGYVRFEDAERSTEETNTADWFNVTRAYGRTGNVRLRTRNRLFVDSSGWVDANEGGFQGATVTGGTDADGPAAGNHWPLRGGGGGHAGSGGDLVSQWGYGNPFSADTWGSGGGSSYRGRGGDGGGIVLLESDQDIKINGKVTAEGGDACDWFPNEGGGGGGGAGGSVSITANGTVYGSGQISVKGGNACYIYGGAGSGGRIVIISRQANGRLTEFPGRSLAIPGLDQVDEVMNPPASGTIYSNYNGTRLLRIQAPGNTTALSSTYLTESTVGPEGSSGGGSVQNGDDVVWVIDRIYLEGRVLLRVAGANTTIASNIIESDGVASSLQAAEGQRLSGAGIEGPALDILNGGVIIFPLPSTLFSNLSVQIRDGGAMLINGKMVVGDGAQVSWWSGGKCARYAYSAATNRANLFIVAAREAPRGVYNVSRLSVQGGGVVDLFQQDEHKADSIAIMADFVHVQQGGVIRSLARGFNGSTNWEEERGILGVLFSLAANENITGVPKAWYSPNGKSAELFSGGSGGGHAGYGGPGFLNPYGGMPYGNTFAPVGSGGGGGAGPGGYGGNGGGGVRFIVDEMVINGTVTVDGAAAEAGGSGGGGAGGSIWITSAGSVSGNGVLSARGGDGDVGRNRSQNVFGGGGAGGRIALRYSGELVGFTGTVRLEGGRQLVEGTDDGDGMTYGGDGINDERFPRRGAGMYTALMQLQAEGKVGIGFGSAPSGTYYMEHNDDNLGPGSGQSFNVLMVPSWHGGALRTTGPTVILNTSVPSINNNGEFPQIRVAETVFPSDDIDLMLIETGSRVEVGIASSDVLELGTMLEEFNFLAGGRAYDINGDGRKDYARGVVAFEQVSIGFNMYNATAGGPRNDSGAFDLHIRAITGSGKDPTRVEENPASRLFARTELQAVLDVFNSTIELDEPTHWTYAPPYGYNYATHRLGDVDGDGRGFWYSWDTPAHILLDRNGTWPVVKSASVRVTEPSTLIIAESYRRNVLSPNVIWSVDDAGVKQCDSSRLTVPGDGQVDVGNSFVLSHGVRVIVEGNIRATDRTASRRTNVTLATGAALVFLGVDRNNDGQREGVGSIPPIGLLHLSGGSALRGSRFTLDADDILVCYNSSIDADNLGFEGGSPGNNNASGPGYGGSGQSGGSGGGHGGYGLSGISAMYVEGLQDQSSYPNITANWVNKSALSSSGGQPYGDLYHPNTAGSGGGSTHWAGSFGGDGGGVVKLRVGGTLLIERGGRVSANGEDTIGIRSGGGAGGSVYIVCDTLRGLGSIQANGGTAALEEVSFDDGGGAGGGGRVAVYYRQRAYNGSIEAKSGAPRSSPYSLVWMYHGTIVVNESFVVATRELRSPINDNSIVNASEGVSIMFRSPYAVGPIQVICTAGSNGTRRAKYTDYEGAVKGEFRLMYKNSQYTRWLGSQASADEVRRALENLRTIEAGTIAVTRTANNGSDPAVNEENGWAWSVTFLGDTSGGTYDGRPYADLKVDPSRIYDRDGNATITVKHFEYDPAVSVSGLGMADPASAFDQGRGTPYPLGLEYKSDAPAEWTGWAQVSKLLRLETSNVNQQAVELLVGSKVTGTWRTPWQLDLTVEGQRNKTQRGAGMVVYQSLLETAGLRNASGRWYAGQNVPYTAVNATF